MHTEKGEKDKNIPNTPNNNGSQKKTPGNNGLQKSVVTENGKLLERLEPQDRLTRFEVCGEQIIDNLKFDFGMCPFDVK